MVKKSERKGAKATSRPNKKLKPAAARALEEAELRRAARNDGWIGAGNEPDEVIEGWVQQVKERIAGLLRQGRAVREGHLHPEEIRWD